jgi:hypothetical protein
VFIFRLSFVEQKMNTRKRKLLAPTFFAAFRTISTRRSGDRLAARFLSSFAPSSFAARVLVVGGKLFLLLAGGNAHDLHGIADHVSRGASVLQAR